MHGFMNLAKRMCMHTPIFVCTHSVSHASSQFYTSGSRMFILISPFIIHTFTTLILPHVTVSALLGVL